MSTGLLSAPRAKHNKYIGQVDRANGVIRHVKILGFNGKKRFYPPAVVAKSLHLYENVPVNIDHIQPGDRRSYRDRIGHIRNVGMEADGVYGDFHINLAHPLSEQVLNDAENAPHNFGFSHDTRGDSRNENGRVVVTGIDRVLSVDLVANPASTSGIWESCDSHDDFPSPLPPEVRRALRGPAVESPIFHAARIMRTVERFTHPVAVEVDPEPLLEDTLEQDDVPRYVPPVSAPLVTRLRRFTR